MNFLLEVDISKPISDLNEKLLYGGKTLLIGIATVFSVLVLLWFTLVMFKFFFHDLAHGKKTKPVKIAEPVPVYSAPAASENDEIIVVIAAAIAMAESECGGNTKFRVVSFKRK